MEYAQSSSSDWLQKQVEKSLNNFSQGLFTPGFRETGKNMCQQVVRTLEKEISSLESSGQVSFTITDSFYGGSYSKNTDVVVPDFEIVFRINNSGPVAQTLEETVATFKSVLVKNSTSLAILPVAIRTGPASLRFWFKNGVKVDILIAPPMKNSQDVIAKIGENRDNKAIRRYYSNSLVQYQLPVIQESSEFVRKLIRLVKFWKSQCDLGETNANLDIILELVCLAACQEQNRTGKDSGSFWTTLVRVFKMLCGLDSLKLAFRLIDGAWKRVNPEAFSPGAVGLVPKVVGYEDFLERKRFILEPMNPYCDLLEELDDRWMSKFIQFASQTKQKIEGLREEKYSSFQGGYLIVQFDKIFEPQPGEIVSKENVKLHYKLPTHIYLSQDRFQHRRRRSEGPATTQPMEFLDIKVRRNHILVKPEVQQVLDLVTKRILGTITCSVGGLRNLNAGVANDDMIKSISETLRNMFPTPPVTFGGTANHTGGRKSLGAVTTLEAFDVTISFPFSNPDTAEFCYGIRVSLKWKD